MIPSSGWRPRSTGSQPLLVPLPQERSWGLRVGAEGELRPGAVVGPSLRVLSSGDADAENLAGITDEGQLASVVRVSTEDANAAALVDWFRLERFATQCDVELVIFDRDDSTEMYVVGTNITKGRASIGQINVRVLDKRMVASDQRTGRFTYALTDEDGRPKIVGRRAVLRRYVEGSWRVLVNGIVMDVRLDSKFVSYTVVIRDFRELERKTEAFTTGGTSCVFPRGTLNSWGLKPDGTYLSPAVTPWKGVFHHTDADTGWVRLDTIPDEYPADLILVDRMAEATKATRDEARGHNVAQNIAVLWRPEGSTGEWTYWRNIGVRTTVDSTTLPELAGGILSPYKVGFWGAATDAHYQGKDAPKLILFRLYKPEAYHEDGTPSLVLWPTTGQRIEFIVLYVGPPSEDWPVHWEGQARDLLVELGNGKHTTSERFHLEYDRVALDAEPRLDAHVLLRLTKAVDDTRKFTEDNVWRALGAAPAWNAAGRIYPVTLALPTAPDALPVLGDAEMKPETSWQHQGSKAITSIAFTYHRVTRREPTNDPFQSQSAGDAISSTEVTITYEDRGAKFDLEGVATEITTFAFSALGDAGLDPISGNAEDELGWQLAARLRTDLFPRYAFGARSFTGTCRWSATSNLVVGSWVRAQVSWNPNYAERRRGSDSLAQVVSIKDASCGWRTIGVEEVVATVEEGVVVLPTPVEVNPWELPPEGSEEA
jgi:hypothetical protein